MKLQIQFFGLSLFVVFMASSLSVCTLVILTIFSIFFGGLGCRQFRSLVSRSVVRISHTTVHILIRFNEDLPVCNELCGENQSLCDFFLMAYFFPAMSFFLSIGLLFYQWSLCNENAYLCKDNFVFGWHMK